MSERDFEVLAGEGKRSCPWCDDYYGAFLRKHAAHAHPAKYGEWREDYNPVRHRTTTWRSETDQTQ